MQADTEESRHATLFTKVHQLFPAERRDNVTLKPRQTSHKLLLHHTSSFLEVANLQHPPPPFQHQQL